MAGSPISTSREFFLLDEPRTLFPMALTRLLIDRAAPALQQYVYTQVLDPSKPEHSFLPQQRAHAAKARHHTRRTAKLDPVAEYFIYDFVYRHRTLFRKPFTDQRRHFGYRFESGLPMGGVEAYGEFRKQLSTQAFLNRHALSFDIAAYFNSVYHHDLVHWFDRLGAQAGEVSAFDQFLREINAGRSVDCLPHGLYPCKMIGNSFLAFVDSSNRIKSYSLLRFMDDFHLFDDDPSTLLADFHYIQFLLGQKGLSVNSEKTVLPSELHADPLETVDKLKVDLLKKRRELMKRYDEHEVDEHPDLQLDDEQKGYLLDFLKSDALSEEDAELVLVLMHEHTDDLLEHLPLLAAGFPNLAKRFHQFCQRLDDKEQLAEVLLALVRQPNALTEFQLFWFGKIVEDHLLKTSHAGELLSRLYEHEHATVLSKARVLEIPENRFGMIELREAHLKDGSSNWLAWAAAAGSRNQPRAGRNYVLAYFGKSSALNHLIADCIAALP